MAAVDVGKEFYLTTDNAIYEPIMSLQPSGFRYK